MTNSRPSQAKRRSAKNARRAIAADAAGFHDPLCREVTRTHSDEDATPTDVYAAIVALDEAVGRYRDGLLSTAGYMAAVTHLVNTVRADERQETVRFLRERMYGTRWS